MRSRYTAHVLHDAAYLRATWHPATRPDDLDPDPDLAWTGLEIVATEAGDVADTKGVVEFRASYRTVRGAVGVLHETSRFSRLAGAWVYVRGRQHEQ